MFENSSKSWAGKLTQSKKLLEATSNFIAVLICLDIFVILRLLSFFFTSIISSLCQPEKLSECNQLKT